ncbi:30S ribosomal protein S8 [Calditrichota bacterium]
MSSTTDPIADYLTRIRNAISAGHRKVDIPSSKLKREISKILIDEGYIRDFLNIEDDKQGILRVFLRFTREGKSTITGIKRVSRPGLRHYVSANDIPRVRNGLGTAVLTTPRGLMSGKKAVQNKVGGEVLLHVW